MSPALPAPLWLDEIHIENFRCLERVEITDLARINVLSGANGAGKTSVLEAISLLSLGNSFQATRAGALIRHQTERLVVRGRVRRNQVATIAVGKDRKDTTVKRNGEVVKSASSLTQQHPLVVITPDVLELVRGGPVQRRRLVDRAMFHVEQGFLHHYRTFHRAMTQRLALLRAPSPNSTELDFWEQQIDELARAIDAGRVKTVERISSALARRGWPEQLPSVEIRYRRGWPDGASLRDRLREGRASDARTARMNLGPHRSELDIRGGDTAARHHFSRGQARIVATALMLAQWDFMAEHMRCGPWLLVDDLGAELASDNRAWLCGKLTEIPAQIFITVTDPELLAPYLPASDTAWFHVEHGTVRLLS